MFDLVWTNMFLFFCLTQQTKLLSFQPYCEWFVLHPIGGGSVDRHMYETDVFFNKRVFDGMPMRWTWANWDEQVLKHNW